MGSTQVPTRLRQAPCQGSVRLGQTFLTCFWLRNRSQSPERSCHLLDPIRVIFDDLVRNRHFGPNLNLWDYGKDWLVGLGPSHIQLPTAFPPLCLAVVQNSVQKSSENHEKLVRIESQGTFWGLSGALWGSLLAQRAKNIENVASLAALRGPSEMPNLRKLGRGPPNASQNGVQNLRSHLFQNTLKTG